MGFEGKTALVTGSARGIGRAISETLASRGANIVIADLQSELAEQTAKELKDTYGTNYYHLHTQPYRS